jgi:hypothetical protein
VDLPVTALTLQERKAGRNWAPIVGTVLFLIDTILMVDGFVSPVAIGSQVMVIFIWLISLAVLGLLWLRASPEFLKQSPLIRVIGVIEVIRAWTKAHLGGGSGSGSAAAR